MTYMSKMFTNYYYTYTVNENDKLIDDLLFERSSRTATVASSLFIS